MDLNSYKSMLTIVMRSVKSVSIRPQPTHVFVQPAVRYDTRVFARRDSHRRPFELAYEGPFKFLQRQPKYYIIDRNRINSSISIDCLKAVYLEGNPNHVYFPLVKSEDMILTTTISHPIIKNHCGIQET